MKESLQRTQAFCERFGLRVPILLAPMAGACPPSLSIAVASAGGSGACGALLMKPEEIVAWAEEVRRGTKGSFQINLWIPDPPPKRDREHMPPIALAFTASDPRWTPPPDQHTTMMGRLPPLARSSSSLVSSTSIFLLLFVRESEVLGCCFNEAVFRSVLMACLLCFSRE